MLGFVVSTCALTAPSPGKPAGVVGRRAASAIVIPGLATVLSPALPAQAAGLNSFTDSRYGVSFGLPAGWEAVPNNLADGRRIVLATDPKDESTNIFIAFTPIRPDYSSLGSFGNIDYVASTVIPQCGSNGECRFANGDAIEGRMLSQETVKGNYVYEYTIEQKQGPKRRLRSLFTIQADGASSILIGLTCQCLDYQNADVGSMFQEVLASYRGKA